MEDQKVKDNPFNTSNAKGLATTKAKNQKMCEIITTRKLFKRYEFGNLLSEIETRRNKIAPNVQLT